MSFQSFFSDLASTILGGTILTLMFFLAKEKWFPTPHITGRWYFEQSTELTKYKPFEKMTLQFVAMIYFNGNRVEGTFEKIYENSSTGEREYNEKDRTRGMISGYIEKNYIKKDQVYLHLVENGHGRESSAVQELTYQRRSTMSGTFTSMVAEQAGTVRWQRSSFR